MKLKKLLIISCVVIFFITAMTSYLNRVIFPQLVKKIAVERIQDTLKRKVEIGSIHFNWVKGFIIDKIKIYEKDSPDIVFAQAEQVSFGILFFPGFKHYRITIPFINVLSPSVHLLKNSAGQWNFSDMSPGTSSASTSTSNPENKTSGPEIAWGGITISNGKFQVDDDSNPHHWSEYFDNINLKLSLSYKGINYNFTADIPDKNGFIGATVYFQPLSKDTQAQIHLKNIDTASYLSLINIPEVQLNSGIINEVNLNISRTQNKISAQGDVSMKNLDMAYHDQTFKGDIEFNDLYTLYENGDINAHGQLALKHMQSNIPGLSTSGSVEAKVESFELTNNGISFVGSLHGQGIMINLKDRHVQMSDVGLDNIKIRKDPDGIQSVGSISTKDLIVQWPNQKLQGDISLKAVTLKMKNENEISLEGEMEANNFSINIDDKTFSAHHILLEDAQLKILDQKNVSINTNLSLQEMVLGFDKKTLTSSSIKTDRLFFNLNDGIIKINTTINATQSRFKLDGQKYLEASPRLELDLQYPLDKPQELTYKGSLTLSDGHIQGFAPIQTLDNIELDTDFQNDLATINALSLNILDTNIHINGTVKNFKAPWLDILAEADDLNLAKIKEIAPNFIDAYGLNLEGSSFVKIQFNGLATNPLSAKILAVASFKNINASSSKWHQEIKHITGIIEATPNTLTWRDFTGSYKDKNYTLAGSLNDFKNPNILFTLEGGDLTLKADLSKNNDLINIHSLSGKYLNIPFNTQGNITLNKDQGPAFDITTNASLLLEDLIKELPDEQIKNLETLSPSGLVSMTADLKGTGWDWKAYTLNANASCPQLTLAGYKMNDLKISVDQQEGKVKNLIFDGKLYNGTVHAVGSLDLTGKGMPYDLALNVDDTDLHLLKMDSPLKMEEIDGKFYFTTVAHGTLADFKNNLHATGSMAIREGFLAEFNLFKGLLSVLNDAMRLGQVEITDVEGNFTIDDQKINTENLRLKGPTIVLLGKGWVNFDELCDLNMTVDLSSGVVPAIAHDVLNTLNIHIYDKISDPKFKKKISVPQVINTLLKNLLQ